MIRQVKKLNVASPLMTWLQTLFIAFHSVTNQFSKALATMSKALCVTRNSCGNGNNNKSLNVLINTEATYYIISQVNSCCVWYRSSTTTEKLFPYETVQAQGRLFICHLCVSHFPSLIKMSPFYSRVILFCKLHLTSTISTFTLSGTLCKIGYSWCCRSLLLLSHKAIVIVSLLPRSKIVLFRIIFGKLV